jgi:hypothetical protein
MGRDSEKNFFSRLIAVHFLVRLCVYVVDYVVGVPKGGGMKGMVTINQLS